MSKTFDEWRNGYYPPKAREAIDDLSESRMCMAYEAGQASRDAEVAELVAAGEFYRDLCIASRRVPMERLIADRWFASHADTLAKYAKGGKDGN